MLHSPIGKREIIAQVKDLHVEYDGQQIVSDVSFDVYKGERLVITGESGSGKSTIIRALGGIVTPAAGNVSILGQEMYPETKAGRRVLANYVRSSFQRSLLDTNLTVRDNLALPGGMSQRLAPNRVAFVAAQLGLANLDPRRDKMNQRAATLSGGEQMRVSIGRALAESPGLLLLDEPTGAMDSHSKEAALTMLDTFNANEGMTIVSVAHDEIALEHADRQIVVSDGRIVDQLLHT